MLSEPVIKKEYNEMSKKTFISIVVMLFCLIGTSLGMMFEIGAGYRFAPSDQTKHGINLDLGLFNDFNDIIELDVTYHPQFINAESEESATPTIFWNFDMDAMIPLLGRRDGIEGYRFGLYSTFEFGSFYSDYTLDATPGSSEAQQTAWDRSDYWFGAGVYAQYFLDPWLFEMSIGLPVINSYSSQDTLDKFLGSFEFKTRYFIKSEIHDFKDHLLVEFVVSTRKIGLSVVLLEPF
ncbi:MAG: hypothetical protein PWQ84_1019 [Thermotogaceae bacterium]|jgi:hypothetical protein|nr:hypothetical protein [Thermotogaceae bacterium]